MPIYNFDCPSCEEPRNDILVRPNRPDPVCGVCGTTLVRNMKPLPIARGFGYSAAGNDYGIRDGTTFHTAAERRAYEDKFKITGLHDQNSRQARNLREEARAQADEAASAQGYKDHETYRSEKRREKRIKRGQTASFERRVQIST